jgi:hypothetical protein
VLILCCADKYLGLTKLKRGKVCFVSQFQRFQAMLVWPRCLASVIKQNITAGSAWWSEAAQLVEAGEQSGRHEDPNNIWKGTCQ